MMGAPNARFEWPVLTPFLAGAAAILSSALVLLGWQLDIVALQAPLGGPNRMVPSTALCFVLCGLALLLQLWEDAPAWRVVAARLLAFAVLVYSLAILSEYVFHVDLGIDNKLFLHAVAKWPLTAFPGRFAPNTAAAFPFIALAVLLLGRRVGKLVVSEVLSLVAGLIAFAGVIGYAYQVQELYSAGTAVQMALHTGLIFMALSVGVFLARPAEGTAQLLADRGPSGMLSRRLLLSTVVLLTVLGWILVEAERKGGIDVEFGTALLVVCSVVCFGVLIIRTARLVRNFERERERATRALIQSEKLASVGRMAATVAHEINNPLAAVTNAIYLVSLDPGLSQQSRENVALADEQLRRVAHITRQTLGFYRERNAASAVDVCSIADDVLAIYQHRLDHAGIKVVKRYRKDGTVWAVAGELRQVVSNLVANSLDALPSGGTVYVRVSRCHTRGSGSSFVRITIADTGDGIAPAFRARLFEPFFTTKESVGTGLGLWVSKDILSSYHGRIRFKSLEGRGTVFSIFLPAHGEPAPLEVVVKASA